MVTASRDTVLQLVVMSYRGLNNLPLMKHSGTSNLGHGPGALASEKRVAARLQDSGVLLRDTPH